MTRAVRLQRRTKEGFLMIRTPVVLACVMVLGGCASTAAPPADAGTPRATPTAAATPTATATPTAQAPTATSTRTPGATPTATLTPTSSATQTVASTARVDYADYAGWLLVQHFGNALDGSHPDPVNGNYGIARFYLMSPDGATIRELLPGQPADGKDMADISPDLKRVVFQDASTSVMPWIHEVGLDGTGYRTITTPCGCIELDPAYSPDGQRIAFVRAIDNKVQLGIRDLATGNVTMLRGTDGADSGAAGSVLVEQPAWSPDGRSIVFSLMQRNGDGHLVSSQIKIIDVASGAIRALPVPADLRLGEPKYSPDGSRILVASGPAYATKGEAFGDVYTMHPDGSALTDLTPGGGTGASWTPDGKHILFYDTNYTSLMDVDGGNKARWSSHGPDLSTTERGYGYTTYWIPQP
jgi:dipeptidyl aminopeptidase/acylaminoacyl peptidase